MDRKEEGGPAPSGERECWVGWFLDKPSLAMSTEEYPNGFPEGKGWECVRMVKAPKASPRAPEAKPKGSSPLIWSGEKPKVPGLYLSRDVGDPNPARWTVFRVTDPMLWTSYAHLEHAGPIPEPTPPEGGSHG